MVINREKCDVCGACVAVCPVDAITVSEFYVSIDNQKCIKCNNCLKICPTTAITSKKEEKEDIRYSIDSFTLDKSPTMTIKEEYDLVVVGAGPGGSVAARYAAEQGLSVLILERDREAGIPVRCAEGISGGSLELFIKMEPRFIANKISRARLNTPNGGHLEMSSNLNGFILERRIFDAALCDLACNKGAVMLTKANAVGFERISKEKVKVFFTYEGKLREVACKIVIGADGVESRVGRWAGLKTNLKLNDISSGVQYTLNNVQVESNLISFYFGNKIAPGGYIWVFPKSENTANVGIGIAGNFAGNKPAKAYLDDFVKETFPEASISYTVYGGIPIVQTLDEIITDNIMLVGDAAHQVNPITGGGIKQAMMAGKLAADTAVEAVKKNDYSTKHLKKYSRAWDNTLGSKHRFIYKIKERVLTAPDEKLNKIANLCKDIPPDKMTLPDLFKAVVKGDSMMVAEMAKAFVLSKLDL